MDPEVLWSFQDLRLLVFGHHGWKQLTPLQYKLFKKLFLANGNIVSREEMLRDVWGFNPKIKTRTIDYFIGRLRGYFEINPHDPKHILTIVGAGYRFEP